VDAANAAEDFGARAQKQMVRIREENLRPGVLEGLSQLPLYRRLRPDGMKSGVRTSL
jgi:hypothetical protein